MSNFTYTTGTPNGALTPAQNRPTMTVNNDSAAGIWDEDHYGFNNNNGGQHQQVTFPFNIADPNQSSPIASLYTKAVSGISQLFFQNGNMASNVVRLTGTIASPVSNSGTAGGSIYTLTLPLGATLYMGQTASISGNKTIVFPVGYTNIITGNCSPNSATGIPSTGIILGNSGATVGTSATVSINWWVIGVI